MSTRNSSSTRALVLGGGGAVGVGWQAGLLTGLRESGVELRRADAVVGTSAGALVGALLSSDRDLAGALRSLAALGQLVELDRLSAGDQAFLRARNQARNEDDPRKAIRAIGRAAQEASTPAEETYLGLFNALEGAAWPSGFRCTAIDSDSGELVVWDEASDVSLMQAVASSCVVPMLFPLITIKGRRYMDGGLISHLNAAAAPPSDILVVLSCHSLRAGNMIVDGASAASPSTANTELAQLHHTGPLIVIEPDFAELGSTENRMMDPSLAKMAYQIGKRQAEHEAPALNAAWSL